MTLKAAVASVDNWVAYEQAPAGSVWTRLEGPRENWLRVKRSSGTSSSLKSSLYTQSRATAVNAVYYTLNSPSLFWLAESVRWIFEIRARDVITADYTIIMSRTLKVTGNHVMYDRGAWFVRVIMSSSRALCCSPSVKEQKQDFNFSVQCIIKQLLDSVFVISRIIEISARVISLSLRLRLITPTSTSIILDITKTSSNNCLLCFDLVRGKAVSRPGRNRFVPQYNHSFDPID